MPMCERDADRRRQGRRRSLFAINGKLNNAEIYGSSALFRKLWPKLLKASAVEAVAEEVSGAKITEPTLATATAFLDEANRTVLAERPPQSKVAIRSQVRPGQQQATGGTTNAPVSAPNSSDGLRISQGESSKVRVVESRDRTRGEGFTAATCEVVTGRRHTVIRRCSQ